MLMVHVVWIQNRTILSLAPGRKPGLTLSREAGHRFSKSWLGDLGVQSKECPYVLPWGWDFILYNSAYIWYINVCMYLCVCVCVYIYIYIYIYIFFNFFLFNQGLKMTLCSKSHGRWFTWTLALPETRSAKPSTKPRFSRLRPSMHRYAQMCFHKRCRDLLWMNRKKIYRLRKGKNTKLPSYQITAYTRLFCSPYPRSKTCMHVSWQFPLTDNSVQDRWDF